MDDPVVYRSRSRIERIKGPVRRAYLPAASEPIFFGMHDEVAEHYSMDPGAHPPRTATIDYLVAATGGWLTGTFGGALEARGIAAGEGYLMGDVVGEIETENKVLVVRRIHVTYHLKAEADKQPIAERVLGFHARACPLARSIGGCVEITTSLEFEEI